MVHTCSAYKCRSRATKDSKLHFHSFPSRTSNKEVFEAWVTAVDRLTDTGAQWLPSPEGHEKLCSKHFLDTDYKAYTNIKILKKDAVPSLFPENPRPVRVIRPIIRSPNQTKKRSHSPDDENDKNALPKVSDNADDKIVKRPSEHSYSHSSPLDHIRRLEEKIKTLESNLAESRAENKILKEKLKRRDNKCSKLNDQLREIMTLSDAGKHPEKPNTLKMDRDAPKVEETEGPKARISSVSTDNDDIPKQ